MLRCSDKSYLVQGFSKSYMCEHIFDPASKISLSRLSNQHKLLSSGLLKSITTILFSTDLRFSHKNLFDSLNFWKSMFSIDYFYHNFDSFNVPR